jgi:hypothetical protein
MVVYQPLGRKDLVATNSAEQADGSTRGNLKFVIKFLIAAAPKQHHRKSQHKQKHLWLPHCSSFLVIFTFLAFFVNDKYG